MIGNLLAISLMSIGMGYSLTNQPKERQNTNWEVNTIELQLGNVDNNAKNVKKALIDYHNKLNTNTLQIKSKITLDDILTEEYDYLELEIIDTYLAINIPNLQNFKWTITIAENNYIYSINNTGEYDDNSGNLLLKNAELYKIYSQYQTSEGNLGQNIVNNVKGGLGLIGNIATEFLAGFTALVWNNGQLTIFALFSLILLGVSVSFAIVKLVLNIVRSNTGA